MRVVVIGGGYAGTLDYAVYAVGSTGATPAAVPGIETAAELAERGRTVRLCGGMSASALSGPGRRSVACRRARNARKPGSIVWLEGGRRIERPVFAQVGTHP
jgi:hypothetical protein